MLGHEQIFKEITVMNNNFKLCTVIDNYFNVFITIKMTIGCLQELYPNQATRILMMVTGNLRSIVGLNIGLNLISAAISPH